MSSVKKPRAPRSSGGSVCTPEKDRQAITLCMRKTTNRPGMAIGGKSDACAYVQDIAHADRENMHILHLDVRNRVIGSERIGIGTLSAVDAHPREIFKAAILNNSASIIMAHNHPSGQISPSQADIDLTERVIKAGKLLGIPVHDHVIVGADHNGLQCYSLRESGALSTNAFADAVGLGYNGPSDATTAPARKVRRKRRVAL